MAEESAVAVCVRVRPLNSREEALGENTQVYWKTGNNAIYQVDGSKSFGFDRVFGSDESTKNVYEEIAVPIIDSAIQGYNGTIFAYGQTASGKTYTMMGSKDYLGVIPRAIHDIFQKIQKFPDREFLLRVSYMEIYNETITDLLCDTQKMKPLIIREDYNRTVYVSDLTEEVVYTSDMALKWITKGEKNRHYGITKMNQRSSRSHTIFRMILESREKGDPSNYEGAVKVSHLNLVDLAGSERAAQTGAEGMRLKEGCNINRSLFILGQVIKKLSDEQSGGFINYRDSKLTRILQNSLGGNAKTRIICTITPVSFDETLSTLQFASTAKYMKNTPYVNEVSNDEALLKRYRKEIMDLKKQLEEVSLETRAQAMEKDQLAQLLEEKDLLQKVQIEKIQNLTRMLVTSSSLSSEQELKAKKKRRVTWCLGKINKMEKAKLLEEFSLPASVTTKTNRSVLGSVGEMDESFYSEADTFSCTLDALAEVEWNPATKLLASQDNPESELISLRVNYDNLVLDYERLRIENKELEMKLKEKNDLDEFEVLERKAEKDQEMQLIYENSNLKNLVKHSEVYTQDLENELSSKTELLREKEDQIKQLQERLDSQKPETTKLDLSYASEPTEDIWQLRQSLMDAETVVLDSKKESAFLKGENRELHEKLRELESRCGQVESELQGSQRQLEARKKMQADLEKELQFSFSEIAKLTSLLSGKVPKDVLSTLELERRISDLQKELKREVEEKEALHKEVTLLAELKSLPSEVEMLRKEILEKSEELSLITSEKDRLLSELVGKESGGQDLLEETGKIRDDPAGAQQDCPSPAEEMPDSEHHRAEDKYHALLEENARMSEQVSALRLSLAALETELSQKSQELQQKMAESQEQQDSARQLQEQLETHESRLRAMEEDRTRVTEQLEQALVDMRTLTQEKDALRAERDQLQCDIQDTVHMNIDTQEQLRDALESVRQKQETISSLRRKLAAEPPKNQAGEENSQGVQGDHPEQLSGGDERPPEAVVAPVLAAVVEDKESQRKIFSLTREKEELQQMLEHVTAEKEQLRSDLQENIEMTIENQEELRTLREKLKRQQEALSQAEAVDREGLASAEERLKEMSQQLREQEQQLERAREELGAAQSLELELERRDAALELVEVEKQELARKLRESREEMESISRESRGLKALQETFEAEREQLQGRIRELEAAMSAAVPSTWPPLPQHMGLCDETSQPHIPTQAQESSQELRSALRPPQKPQETEAEALGAPSGASGTQECPRTPELPQTQEPLTDNTQETTGMEAMLGGLEPQDGPPQSPAALVSANAEWEQPCWAGDVQACHQEIASLVEERDQLRRARDMLEAECNRLKENLSQSGAQTPCAQVKPEQLFSDTDDSDGLETMAEAQPWAGGDGAQLAQVRDPVHQPEGPQGREEPMREILAKHQEAEEELAVARRLLQAQEGTIEELRATLCDRETQASCIQQELDTARKDLERQIQELEENRKQLGVEKSEALRTAGELQRLRELLMARDASLQSSEQEKLQLLQQLEENQVEMDAMRKEQGELHGAQTALAAERDRLAESLRAAEAELDRERSASLEDMQQVRRQLEAQQAALASAEVENVGLVQRLQEHLEEAAAVTRERDGLSASLREAAACAQERQEELVGARGHLQEQQEAVQSLREHVSKTQEELASVRAELETTNAALQAQALELQEKDRRLCDVTRDLGESRARAEQLEQQLESQHAALGGLEAAREQLAQQLQETLEEVGRVSTQRDTLEGARCTEREQLEEKLRVASVQTQERQEELEAARGRLQEQQEAMQSLRGLISEKEEALASTQAKLETTNAKLQEKTQELRTSERQLCQLWENMGQMEKQLTEMQRLQKQVKSQGVTLDKLELENLNLAQQLHDSQQETKSLTKERDSLRRAKEALRLEQEQLRDSLQASSARHLEVQQELDVAHSHLKEHQETIQRLKERVSEKTAQISHIQKDFKTSEDELHRKIQDLQKKQRQLLKMKEHVGKARTAEKAAQCPASPAEAPRATVPSVEAENLLLAQTLRQSREELRAVAQEREELRRRKESLGAEQAQRAGRVQDPQEQRAAMTRCDSKLPCDGKQTLTKSLREKCSRIKELVKKYAEMNSRYECLDKLAEDLERDIGTQKELSARVKAKLPLPYAQAKQVDKALTGSLRASMELLRIMKKLKYVLSHVTKIKEEQHESINKFETAFIEEVEKQNELLVKIQHLQQDYNEPARGSQDLKLSQNMDLHLEEILRDLSESDFHSMKAEFEEMLSNRKETVRLLEEWLSTRFDTEKLKDSVQKASHRICAGNNVYNSKILTILNESTEFEERNAALTNQWEHDLRAMREKRETLCQSYQALLRSQPPAAPPSPGAAQDEKQRPLLATAPQRSSEVRELEVLLHEARGNVQQKDSRIAKMQKELEASQGSVAMLQGQVSELKDNLEKAKGTVQALQDRVALGAKPYKEEIEELKTKLVRRDLEMLTDNKELKKELTSSRAVVEHQKELIRVLRENLRRTQQAHDTSMVSEHADAQPPSKPLTCGGGSGIVQSTKALILKSEYVRLEKENCQLKQQNEQLTKQKNELLSNNQQLCSEVRAWKERTLRREAHKNSPSKQSPKSPKGPGAASKRHPHAPTPSPTHFRERNAGHPEPQRCSPGAWFLDNRCKSLPSPRPARYFDNSSLGLPGLPSAEEVDGTDAQSRAWLAESSVDVPECKTQ